MSSKTIIAFLVIAVAVAGFICYFWLFDFGKESQLKTVFNRQGEEILPLPADGNIDVAIDSFLREAAAEQSVIKEVESDSALIKNDSQAVDDFGQSVNENEL